VSGVHVRGKAGLLCLQVQPGARMEGWRPPAPSEPACEARAVGKQVSTGEVCPTCWSELLKRGGW
jgi:hypothetical protein